MEKNAAHHLPMLIAMDTVTQSSYILATSKIFTLRLIIDIYDPRFLASWAIDFPWVVGTVKEGHAETKIW